jgi:hypothetical protein
MARLEHATARELADAAARHTQRIAAIDAGTAPASPDSRAAAESALARIRGEQRRRGIVGQSVKGTSGRRVV